MPIRTKQHMDDVKEDILQALLRCIARKGIADTTIADLIAESGLSAGAIYRHFENKDALLIGLMRHRVKAVTEEIVLEELGSFDFWKFIDWTLKRVAETQHVYLVDLEFASLARVNPKVRTIYLSLEKTWVAMLKKCLATLPDAKVLFDNEEILDDLVEALRATGNHVILRRMIGQKVDVQSFRRQVEMNIEGAFSMLAKAEPALRRAAGQRAIR
ncbi:MAG: TetR/AcrR family transcriptional regulator [Solimonas sp.]